MSENEEPVLWERHGAVVVVRLHRPERLNAVTLSLYRALAGALRRAETDEGIRAIVLTGSGRAFCVGADLVAHREPAPDPAARRTYVEAAQGASRLLRTIPKPVVAAVNGHAIGAGLELAIACDFVVVASDAKLRFPELALGSFIGGGTIFTLTERVGLTRAKELLFLGAFFSGEEAAAMGLVNRAVPAEGVLESALEMAGQLTQRAPIALAHAKQLLDRARHVDADTAMELEAEALLACMETRDWREGIEAFHEKRTPRFRGR